MTINDNNAAVLTAKNVWKIYGSGEIKVEALCDISFSLNRGEIIAVMGPSGCGKTSLLNCLSGIDGITKGEIVFEENVLSELPSDKLDELRANRMGFVFQTFNLIPVLSAVENVELPMLCNDVLPKVAREKALKALARVGLENRKDHLPSKLSGGQQQRVAIARSIVNNPQVIWADEPTGALDRETTQLILDLFEHLNRVDGITLVIVTHNPKVAEIANRVVFMDSGAIIQERVNKNRMATNANEWFNDEGSNK